jgi:hypothetical protein
MKNKEFFTVKINDVDESLRVKDFNSNIAPAPLEAGQFLYVGYYKPFTQFYVEFENKNDVDVGLLFEYFDGNNWVELASTIDETQDFLQSGFIYFERPTAWASVEVDGDENFYVRIASDIDLNAITSIRGINVLLSNDEDLEGIRSNIVSKLNSGKSWIVKHEAAKKYIIQHLRSLGYRKVTNSEQSNTSLYFGNESLYFSNLTAFDFLEPFELREAAKYKAASMIYLDELSDEEDDKYYRMGIRHGKTADEMLNLFSLKIDSNDNGIEDAEENEGDTGTNLTWA